MSMTAATRQPTALAGLVNPQTLVRTRVRLAKLRAVAEQIATLGHDAPESVNDEITALASATVHVEVPCIGCKATAGVEVRVDDPHNGVPRVVICEPCDVRIARARD